MITAGTVTEFPSIDLEELSEEESSQHPSRRTGSEGGTQPKAADPLAVVQTLPGVVEVHELLGLGSFSYVYTCSVQGCEERVAVKLLAGHQDPLGECREAALLTEMRHPQLVRLLKILEGPPLALVLELCAGGSLQELLHGCNGGTDFLHGITLAARARVALDVALAVQYLHEHDIVHRDVKSGNTFLTDKVEVGAATLPRAKLGDLGLARACCSSAMMTRGVGTVRYMAPEVISSGDYGLPADIYSCGVLLHEVLTGEVPYGRLKCNPAALAVAIVQGEHRLSLDLPSLGIRQPSTMPKFLEDALRFEPEERLTASDFVAGLAVQVGVLHTAG